MQFLKEPRTLRFAMLGKQVRRFGKCIGRYKGLPDATQVIPQKTEIVRSKRVEPAMPSYEFNVDIPYNEQDEEVRVDEESCRGIA